jgi:hypothetical protein
MPRRRMPILNPGAPSFRSFFCHEKPYPDTHCGAVVFRMTEKRLAEPTGDNPENLTSNLEHCGVVAAGRRDVTVCGPFASLEAEIAEGHRDFWRKRARKFIPSNCGAGEGSPIPGLQADRNPDPDALMRRALRWRVPRAPKETTRLARFCSILTEISRWRRRTRPARKMM